ncbi:hypothetical protein [Methanococcus voltae]|uniref:Uncharacterized protein n=1 Tax=Methanococcus voltae (strain ATCC BAA-1334 / A3) TaxID=456320 RepID=D7DRB5_METV3|nr:hypothetical protein [Methanococcus voltae]MCS3901052.1 hypothetical protein [Methanococcus voltae]
MGLFDTLIKDTASKIDKDTLESPYYQIIINPGELQPGEANAHYVDIDEIKQLKRFNYFNSISVLNLSNQEINLNLDSDKVKKLIPGNYDSLLLDVKFRRVKIINNSNETNNNKIEIILRKELTTMETFKMILGL